MPIHGNEFVNLMKYYIEVNGEHVLSCTASLRFIYSKYFYCEFKMLFFHSDVTPAVLDQFPYICI